MRKMTAAILLIALLSLVQACSPTLPATPRSPEIGGNNPLPETSAALPTSSLNEMADTPTSSLPASPVASTSPTVADTTAPSATAPIQPTRNAEDWQNWPVIPEGVSTTMKQIYQEGLKGKNHAERFSKIGDCQNNPIFYLTAFDKTGKYNLGKYQSLQETITYFHGSFSRKSAAVAGGMNVAAVQNVMWNHSEECEKNETPLACELRLNQPSIAIVSYEELWGNDLTKYEKYYDRLIQELLKQKIVPILATTAVNKDANQIIARLAVKYDLPVWNLWGELKHLDMHGTADGFHLTQWDNIFDFTNPKQFSGWHIRNLTALQAIDAVWHALKQ